jgi:hypothetical protein
MRRASTEVTRNLERLPVWKKRLSNRQHSRSDEDMDHIRYVFMWGLKKQTS